MPLSEGQALALAQAKRVESIPASGFFILHVREPPYAHGWLNIDCAFDCEQLKRAEGGLPLGRRERVTISVPWEFPFATPSVYVPHTRFERFAHVQWRHRLCLYQASDSEWHVSDGMFGFLERLWSWFEKGALNQLDPSGEPLHPPPTYATPREDLIVVRSDPPAVTPPFWIGYAHLIRRSATRLDVVGWIEVGTRAEVQDRAPAVLLSEPFPFEFPSKLSDLSELLSTKGVGGGLLIAILTVAALRGKDGEPLYIVIGTPQRGISGSAELKQHLAVWRIPAEVAGKLRLMDRAGELLASSEGQSWAELQALAADIYRDMRAKIDSWIQEAAVSWCRIAEERPDVVTRRDATSPAAAFRDKAVELWGCGALGSYFAELLARAGVRKLILRDKGEVRPGLLVRQNFVDADVGDTKVEALAKRLRAIRPDDLVIDFKSGDLVSDVLSAASICNTDVDLLVDATASGMVHAMLERRIRDGKKPPPQIASLMIDRDASRAVVHVIQSDYSAATVDVMRRLRIRLGARGDLDDFISAFWPDASIKLFQPEPGCSDPTFVASGGDVCELASRALNLVAAEINKQSERETCTYLLRSTVLSAARPSRSVIRLVWHPDYQFLISGGRIQVRIARFAWRDLRAWISHSSRERGEAVETGGLLFGQTDASLGVVWISEVLGPPVDSTFSETGFVCGTAATRQANNAKKRLTGGLVSYVGTWHTHPQGMPVPSATDYRGVGGLLLDDDHSTDQELMLIVGERENKPAFGVYVFSVDRTSGDGWNFVLVREGDVIDAPPVNTPPVRIGLALSGGGSRAIAFHLGCLRALEDLHLLEAVPVISSVSGGSVISALYAYSTIPFGAFDQRTRAILQEGLASRIVRAALISVPAVLNLPRLVFSVVARTVLTAVSICCGGASPTSVRGKVGEGARRLRAQIRRPFNLTNAFANVLAGDRLFGAATLTAPRRHGLEVVINATDLATGTAFRFGSKESGNWRLGRVADNTIRIADAVAASAAYPLFLPLLDTNYVFLDKHGNRRTERVTLTDGGVYENLGVTCLEPGRDPETGFNNFPTDVIVSCDAGAGQWSRNTDIYLWPARVARSFDSIYRKAQDPIKARMHAHSSRGEIKGFAYIALGQMDDRLPWRPSALPNRSDVVGYPTDFWHMSGSNQVEIAARGEQLARLLVAHYLADELG